MENNKDNNPLINSQQTKEKPNFIEYQKQLFAKRMAQNATEEITKAWYEKFLNLNFEYFEYLLSFMHQFFQVKTSEVIQRIMHSLVPFNPKLIEISQNNPDVYGPFWIYTTLIFVLAASGALTKFLNGYSTKAFFQNFVPFAAGLIYGVGFLLPIVITLLMKCFGSQTTFVSTLCLYGYSFSIYIPMIAVCAVPFSWLQWLLIGYAVFSSTGLLLVNFWKELNKYMEKRKYFILFVILVFQVGLFFGLKLYFFEKIIENITPN